MSRHKRRHARPPKAHEAETPAPEVSPPPSPAPALTMPAPPAPETVRVRGIVERIDGDDTSEVLVRSSRTLKFGETERRDVGERFRVRTDSGSMITVEVEMNRDVTFVPMHRDEGPWRTLESNALAARFRDQALAPETAVIMTGFQLVPGDRIEALGEVTEHAFDEHIDGLREAPVQRVSGIRARIVAGGANPRRAMDTAMAGLFPALERTRPRPRATKGTGHRFVVFATLIAMIAFPLVGIGTNSFSALIDAVFGSITLLATLIESNVPPAYPSFEGHASAEKTNVADVGTLISVMVGWFCAVLLAVAMYADAHDTTRCASRGLVWFVEPLLATSICVRFFMGRAGRLVSGGLLRAPTLHRDSAQGTWGRVEGTVLDRTPVTFAGEEVAIGREHDVKVVPGSDPNIVKTNVLNRATFFVDAPDMIVEVDPKDAAWATTERSIVRTPTGRIERDVVPIGARVVVTGEFVPSRHGAAPELRSRPSKPVVFFATARSADAIVALQKIRRRHWLGLALLIACACGVAGVAAAADPFLPLDRDGGD